MRSFLISVLILTIGTAAWVTAQTQTVAVEHCSQAGLEFFIPHTQDSLPGVKNRLADPARVAAATQVQTMLKHLAADLFAGRVPGRNPDDPQQATNPQRVVIALLKVTQQDTNLAGPARQAALDILAQHTANQAQVLGTYECTNGTCTFVPKEVRLIWYDPTGQYPYHIPLARFAIAELDAAGYRVGNQTLMAYFTSQNGTPGLSMLMELNDEPYMTIEACLAQTVNFNRRAPIAR